MIYPKERTIVSLSVIQTESNLQSCSYGGEGGGLPCPIMKIEKSALISEKKYPDFGKSALFVCICGLNSHSKYSFRVILEKITKIFQCVALLLCVIHETFIEVLLFQETSLAPTNSSLHT